MTVTEQECRNPTGHEYNRGCRCGPCVIFHRNRMRRARRQRAERRVLIDGRWVAPLPPERHGRQATYSNWFCRCLPCTEANSQHCLAYRKQRKAKEES